MLLWRATLAVREAAVVARVDGDGDPRLVAYYVAAAPPTGRELHEFVARSLPDYMVPAQWVSISALPLTASGKVDRLALPDPDQAGPARTEEFVALRDDLEQRDRRRSGAACSASEAGRQRDETTSSRSAVTPCSRRRRSCGSGGPTATCRWGRSSTHRRSRRSPTSSAPARPPVSRSVGRRARGPQS